MRSLSGPITFKRNYHQCEECKYGFTRMKRARQRWTMRNARRMPDSAPHTAPPVRFHYARYGNSDMTRCARAASN